VDHPFNPLSLALGADGTFVARAMDRDPKHLKEMILRSHKHKGASMLEIYQNCIVFNDGAFELFTDKKTRPQEAIYLEHGEPMVFGKEKDKGIRLDGLKPQIVELGDQYSKDDLWVHDETDSTKAHLLSRFFEHPANGAGVQFPRPFGVLYAIDKPTYDEGVVRQVELAKEKAVDADMDDLLKGNETWTVK
jgi:2-oxoglutarate ferredoxin oxidoreductase subunit beta